MKSPRWIFAWMIGGVLLVYTAGEVIRHIAFGLPETFLWGHVIYVAGCSLLLLKALFAQMGLTRRIFVYSTGVLLLAFAALEWVQVLVFGLPEEFLRWHLLYVAGFISLLMGPFWWILNRRILRPLARLVEANRHAVAGREADAFIPFDEIPDDEIGEVMHIRNETLKELRQREEKFRSLVESTPDWVWEVDAERCYVYSSPSVRDILGYEPTEIVGRTPFEFLASKEEVRRVRTLFDAAFSRHEALVALENVAVHKDGRHVVLETSGVPILRPDGTVTGYRGIDRDITDRKRVEEALRESERRFRETLENVHLLAVGLDEQGHIDFCNECLLRLTEYRREEVLGRSWFELFVPPELPVKAVFLKAIAAGNIPPHYENEILTRRGERRLIAWSNTMLLDSKGRAVGTISIGEDVTERNRLEDQLRQAQKMEALGTLAGGLAHDFNNMLTGIMGFAQLALLEPDLCPQARECIAKIPDQAQRAAKLVSQLLAIGRRATVDRQPISLLALVKETVTMLERTVPEHIAIRLEAPQEMPQVNGDATQLQQVILNLCINAYQAMPAGGELSLHLACVILDESECRKHAYVRPGRHVRMSVHDTGAGMTSEVQERIFEPFFTTKGIGEGTGLGLAMVYGIVQSHEGYVEVHSEIGKGSVFSVYLPAVETETPREVLSRDAPPKGGEEVLLLVEDEETVLALSRRILERLGYTVLTAADGQEALRVYGDRGKEIALVLADVVMPKMGGRALSEALRRINPDVRVLLTSGHSLHDDLATLRATGAVGFIQKPFDLIGLGRAVREALDG